MGAGPDDGPSPVWCHVAEECHGGDSEGAGEGLMRVLLDGVIDVGFRPLPGTGHGQRVDDVGVPWSGNTLRAPFRELRRRLDVFRRVAGDQGGLLIALMPRRQLSVLQHLMDPRFSSLGYLLWHDD